MPRHPAAPRGAPRRRRRLRRDPRRRRLVHHPYDSFATSVEASSRRRPTIRTCSRSSRPSTAPSDDRRIVAALIEAAEDGKQVVCLVELKARFDEQRTSSGRERWRRPASTSCTGSRPEDPRQDALVVRREGDGLRRYVAHRHRQLQRHDRAALQGPGLFTADEDIGADVTDLFNYLTGYGRPQRSASSWSRRSTCASGSSSEIRAVAAGPARKRARIRLKMNRSSTRR